MDHFAGLDVSVKETSVCIVDDTGKIVREVKVASEPEALLAVLKNPTCRFKRIGLEAGPLSQWLFSALAEAALPVVCVETRHMQAVLKAQINKTDRNDARGIAQMMRVGLYRPVHVKTLRSQKLRMYADPSQAAAVEGHRHRERSTGYFTQLRSQGPNHGPTCDISCPSMIRRVRTRSARIAARSTRNRRCTASTCRTNPAGRRKRGSRRMRSGLAAQGPCGNHDRA